MARNDIKYSILEKDGEEYYGPVEHIPTAKDIAFSDPNFDSDNVGEALTEVGGSASPGFSFGREGLVTSGTWLKRPGNVPSNRAGVTVNIDNPRIVAVACANRNVDTYNVSVYEHDGNQDNLTLLTTVNIVSDSSAIFLIDITCTKGRQLAVRLTGGANVRDIGVDLTLKGNN